MTQNGIITLSIVAFHFKYDGPTYGIAKYELGKVRVTDLDIFMILMTASLL